MQNKFLLMQAKTYPEELISALAKIFSELSSVKKAYIALIQLPDPNKGPDILVAIDSNDEVKKDIDYIGRKLSEYGLNLGSKGLFVVDISEAPFFEYFKQIKPFYCL